MARILIVDDEKDIISLIKRFAEHEGYETMSASGGEEAVELCRLYDFDIIIMDVMMPGMDGFTACREIRKMKDIPVLMLSALGSEYDKLLGFENGIDDYVVKPFSPRELMARVSVIVGRHNASKTEKTLDYKGISVNREGRTVTVDGKVCDLTAKEFELLVYLMENRGIALSRSRILDAVWGYEYDALSGDRTVDWQIKLLRSKLGDYRDAVATVRGVGYKFEA